MYAPPISDSDDPSANAATVSIDRVRAGKYRRMGMTLFNGLVERCKTDAGFAALGDVTAGVKIDVMESYFMAEAVKYFYLLFAPP